MWCSVSLTLYSLCDEDADDLMMPYNLERITHLMRTTNARECHQTSPLGLPFAANVSNSNNFSNDAVTTLQTWG